MHLIVENNDSLLNILAVLSPESSKTTLRSWLSDGRITVDGEVIKQGNIQISKGKKIELSPKSIWIDGNIRILYEDRDLIVIDKPHGLLTVATAFEKEDTAHKILQRYYHPRRVQVVHRLDQGTSGVMLFAFSHKAYEGLKALFETHSIERCYYARVEGVPSPEKGTWQSYLYEDEAYVVHSTSNPEQGRVAITHYAVKQRRGPYSLLELKLETGRKNQIRVHCSDHGCPVAGDKKYGSTKVAKRLYLHAQSLGFIHPITDRKMQFTSPLPDGF